MSQNEVGLTYDDEHTYCWGMEIKTKQNTVINYFKGENGVESIARAFEAEGQISVWNHFDATWDEEGYSIVYLNGVPIIEYTNEIPITPH